METVLMLAQIVFYFTVSIAIIVMGVLCVMVTYHLIRIVKELEKLSRNLNDASDKVANRISDIIERLSDLPILSFFLRKRKK